MDLRAEVGRVSGNGPRRVVKISDWLSSRFGLFHPRMGSLKKRRKAKINRHKRRKKLRLHRHKKRTWQQ
jgi:hypothetical protein